LWLALGIFFLFPSFLSALGPDSYERIIREEQKEMTQPEIARPAVEYRVTVAKDPFILYVEEQKTAKTLASVDVTSLPADFTLQGIIWGGRLNQAVIKNKVVKVGDKLGDVSILDISKSGVSVFYKGRKFELASPANEKLESLKKKAGGTDEK
jgi:hypothetical protein